MRLSSDADLMVLVNVELSGTSKAVSCCLISSLIFDRPPALSYLKVLPCDSQVVLLAALYSDDDTHLIAVLEIRSLPLNALLNHQHLEDDRVCQQYLH